MSNKKTSDEPTLLDVSIRPENKEKVVLFHFSDNTFHNIPLAKGMTKRIVCLIIENINLKMQEECDG